ncbi:glycosyltransferase family 4 protein [Mucilaginibacter sp. AW1-3]
MQQKLKVLLFSHYFYPSLGGIESVSLTLAQSFTKYGIDCKMVTKTVENAGDFDFEVIRAPGLKQQINLVKWADIVFFNGASLALQPWTILLRKPFIWVHQSYIVSCIDGLGWVEGVKAPLTPWASVKYHTKLKGPVWGIKEGIKLWLKRMVALHFVNQNVAITEWVSKIQPLPGQVVIYNPFPIGQFAGHNGSDTEYDLVFLGRIVSEKGVSTLLKGFARVVATKPGCRLLIIGDGNWRKKMEALAAELKIARQVDFVGKKSGKELVDWVAKGRIAVIPSEWYEPMGGVVLELMAAGKNLIVSEYGGLAECAGDAAITFPNGDDEALAGCVLKLLDDEALSADQLQKAAARIKLFDPEIFVLQYIALLNKIVKREN